MTDPFIAEIVMFGGNFAPRGWARCDGQLLSIASYSALFSLVGTTYGGNGETTFGLPELRGRTAVHWGSGPGLNPISWGQRGGSNTNTLTANNLPVHQHALVNNSNEQTADQTNPDGNVLAEPEAGIYSDQAATVRSGAVATGNNSTANSPVNNMQPFIGILHIIALQGVFPSPN